jgi:segregation and condensation protein B
MAKRNKATQAEQGAVTARNVAVETVALSDIPGMAMHLADEGGAGAAPASDPAELPVSTELKAIIEALVFASPEPLTPKALFKLLDSEPREDVERALASLKADYRPERGLQMVDIAGGLQIVTRTDLHEWVRRLFHERKLTKLSVQALETLAVVAYRQPVTAVEIAEIRGVNTSGVLGTLVERKLVKIAGRKPVVGRPFLYATTREFLMRFGLNDLTDLPRVEDMADVLGFEIPGLGETGPSDQLLPLEAPDGPQAPAASVRDDDPAVN